MKKTLLLLLLFASAKSHSQVTYERLLGAAREPQNWLTYSGRYSGWRYSTLNQVKTGNASRLALQWAFQVADLGQVETTPIVVDGVLYGTGQNGRAFALDARTGRAIWRYQRNLPEKLQPCCGMVNRGFAILGDRLFMATLDANRVFTLLGAKGLDLGSDFKTAKMPPVNEGRLDGELAWRQHDGGHTDAPNMKWFIQWADKFIGHAPPQ